MRTTLWSTTALLLAVTCLCAARGQESQPGALLHIPAFTAYSEPHPEALQFEDGGRPPEWKSPDDQFVWYGEVRTPGALTVSVTLRLPAGQAATLRLRLADESRTARVAGGDRPVTAEFGSFELRSADYYRFELAGLARSGDTFGQIESLDLGGPAATGARFNLKPRRNAASVHLGYPTDAGPVEWFYNEVTARTDPVHSFYMACGFHRGYFGLQVISPTERRIIFSVWDSGRPVDERAGVAEEDRVTLLAKGDDVVTNDFGGEGTGGHSHRVYDWKTGQTYRCLLTARPDGGATIYSAYFYFPERGKWDLIASFRAPKDGGYLRGLHSFNENFWGTNGQLQRLAEFGPPWIRTTAGHWQPLTRVTFTTDPTGRDDRGDYGAGVSGGRFYLSNGGFTGVPIRTGGESTRPRATQPGTTFEIPPHGEPPADIRLP